jgi:hypothetical protein
MTENAKTSRSSVPSLHDGRQVRRMMLPDQGTSVTGTTEITKYLLPRAFSLAES